MSSDSAIRNPQSTIALDGLLVVDKPSGWTSHDVVARVRRITGVRRVGHAGTLDPMATGVLPLGVGAGTRVIEYLAGADKTYRATVRLGVTTDTDDAEGVVQHVRDWRHLTERQVREALAGFVGEIEQTPPAFSAIKRGGVPLYKLARAGKPVTPEPRAVTVYSIDVFEVALPAISFEVRSSKGTYVRSLARDLGEALECGGHLSALRRLRTGPLDLGQAVSIDEIEEGAASGTLAAMVLPPDSVLFSMPALVLGGALELRLLTGRAVGAGDDHRPGTVARAYGVDGAFLGLARRGDDAWLPEKILASA